MAYDTFNRYQEMTAKLTGPANCGPEPEHHITKGDRIGYNRTARRVVCSNCWRRWCAENDEARRMEQGY